MSKVTSTLGYTVNLGDFQSVRIDASIEVDTDKDVAEQIKVGLEAVKQAWLEEESKIGEALRELDMAGIKTDTIAEFSKKIKKIEKDMESVKKLTASEHF